MPDTTYSCAHAPRDFGLDVRSASVSGTLGDGESAGWSRLRATEAEEGRGSAGQDAG